MHKTPISTPRKRKEKTASVTMRLPKWWKRRLRKIAWELSIGCDDDISYTDLIRDLIFHTYIEPRSKTQFPKNCKDCENRRRVENMINLAKWLFN